jgi:protein gp37
MSIQSDIEWTDATWNPVTGCDSVSPGCDHCYARTFAERWRGTAGHPYEQGFDLKLWPDRLELPLHWKKPRRIFVNSMSDLFHSNVPDDFIRQVFDTMRQAHWHTFQILTKRAGRLRLLAPHIDWPDNVWIGVSIENNMLVKRADVLRNIPAIRFLSLEPLIWPLPDLDLTGIDWAIVGAESGNHARPMSLDWVREIRDKCAENGVAFFFKQMVIKGKKHPTSELDGVRHIAFPEQRRERVLA